MGQNTDSKENSQQNKKSQLYSRREFLKISAIGVGGASLLWSSPTSLFYLQGIPEIDNPLDFYPNRSWERIYRNQYKFDSSFTYICSPNCTHECRMRGFTRNGVMIRTE